MQPLLMLVRLSGDIDIAVKDALSSQLEQAAEQSNAIDIDLSAVQYADSTALSLLVHLRNTMRERGGKMRLVAPSGRMRKLLEYSGLNRAFEVVESV